MSDVLDFIEITRRRRVSILRCRFAYAKGRLIKQKEKATIKEVIQESQCLKVAVLYANLREVNFDKKFQTLGGDTWNPKVKMSIMRK